MGEIIYPKPDQFSAQQVMDDPILRYFHFAHLPPALREISEPFCDLAAFVVERLPRNAERSVALRKLLEAKDAAVRANVETVADRKETFYDRLLVEHKDVATRQDKLAEFTGTPEFNALPVIEQTALRDQFAAMGTYKSILASRIRRANNLGFEHGRPAEDGEVKITGGDKAETPIPFD